MVELATMLIVVVIVVVPILVLVVTGRACTEVCERVREGERFARGRRVRADIAQTLLLINAQQTETKLENLLFRV